MLVTVSRDAVRFVRTATGPPESVVDAVRRGTIIDDRCHLRCTLAEASAFRDWLHAQVEATRPTRPAIADVRATAADDVAKAIALDQPQPSPVVGLRGDPRHPHLSPESILDVALERHTTGRLDHARASTQDFALPRLLVFERAESERVNRLPCLLPWVRVLLLITGDAGRPPAQSAHRLRCTEPAGPDRFEILLAGWPASSSGAALALIEPGNQPRRAGAVGIVLAAELRVQQRLLRAYAREERRDNERCEQQADPGTKARAHPSELTSNPR
jgi:hypothetical protein